MLESVLRALAFSAAAMTGAPEVPTLQPPATQQPGAPAVGDVMVVTASRREEQLRNAPATMTVLTEASTDHVPGVTVTELLLHVPGVNIAQMSVRDVNVTPRAASGTLSDSLLVLLDGRSLYQDFFGSVMWDFVPIDLHQVKQIEVIRGPASAVWGANAMNGVVNVISKTPREMQGTYVGIRFGQFDRTPPDGSFDGGGVFSINATHAATVGERFAYKVSGEFFAQEAFLRPTGPVPGNPLGVSYPDFQNRGTRQPRLDARVDYDLAGERRSLVIAGGITGTEGMLHSGLGPLDVRRGSTFKYGRVAYQRDALKIRAFVNALDGDAQAVLLQTTARQPLEATFENQSYDVELSNLHVFGDQHVVSYGGNYRYNNFDLSIAARGTHRQEVGAYVQDTILLSDRFWWIVGLRVDGFDVLQKAVFSPRTTLLVKPHAEHTLRLSYNRAFRAPSFVNSYLDVTFFRNDLGTVLVPFSAVGNENLKEEALSAYEVAYSATIGALTAGAAVYVNQLRNAIQFTQTGPLLFSYDNLPRITDRGVEVTGDLRVNTVFSVFANYSWQDKPGARGVRPDELHVPPRHRVNAGINAARGRYLGSLSASFVDSAFWQDVVTPYVGTTDSYTLVDGVVGFHSGDRQLTVLARGTNLLNRRVQQHVFGDVIRRALTGEIQIRF
jgi:iron complex outermembrane receptor protein